MASIVVANEKETKRTTNDTVSLRSKKISSPFFLNELLCNSYHLNFKKQHLNKILILDISRNEISSIPGLQQLTSLKHLDISRNWFNHIPPEIISLKSLVTLNARRNFLRQNEESLGLKALLNLANLKTLDIQWNNKCKRQDWLDLIKKKLNHVPTILMTVTFPAPPGSFVGASPSARDARQLRAQIEPLGTLTLRRRLVDTFGLLLLVE